MYICMYVSTFCGAITSLTQMSFPLACVAYIMVFKFAYLRSNDMFLIFFFYFVVFFFLLLFVGASVIVCFYSFRGLEHEL